MQFQCISFDAAQKLSLNVSNHLTAIKNYITGTMTHPNNPDATFERIYSTIQILNSPQNPILKTLEAHDNGRPGVIFRQAGDSAILVEFGPPNATMHKVDEAIALHDLAALERVYQAIVRRVLG